MKKIIVLFAIATLSACRGTVDHLNGQQVYFGFDSAVITDDARDNLLGQSMFMKNNPDIDVVMEGHCDERGTTEYNLALGSVRASNAAHVLIHDGIESERIRLISYGKENPQYLGTGEQVWAKNRNATTRIAR